MNIDANTPPSEICIIRLSAIGDTCHTVPVVRSIQRAWPHTRVTWIIGRIEHGLLDGLEEVDFCVLDKSAGLGGYLTLRDALRDRKFSILLHMHASMRANLASLMVSADIRLGFDKARARDYQWYFCNEHIPASPNQHVMDGLLEFAKALGISDLTPRWNIPVREGDRRLALEVIEEGRPSLVISPCTGQRFRNYRNWNVENYSRAADYVAARYGARIILTGGASNIENTYGNAIVGLTRCEPVNLIGKTSLKQLLPILERASVVLCPDSGPAHMSTAVGTPVVGLYATSNRFRTGPYLSQHLVVDKYPEAVRREFQKSVDELRWGQRVRNPNAMSLITLDDVVEKLDLAFHERGITPAVGS